MDNHEFFVEYQENFKKVIREKNVQLRRKNQVNEMNAMKAAIRKHVKTGNGSIVLNVEEIDTDNIKDKVDLGAGINKEIPSTCDAKAEMWIKRKIEDIEFYMDLYREAKEEYNKTKDWKAKDKMTEYREIILNSNNFCIDKFNFSPMKLIKPNMEEILIFNQAIRYLAKLVNSISDWNTKSAYSKRREITSFLGSKYGDEVVIQAKAQKVDSVTGRVGVNILLSPRANKIYPDPNNSLFIHLSSSSGLTELRPGTNSNYGDFVRFGGKWLYKNPCVHFFAIKLKAKQGPIINEEKIKSLMEIYGKHIYLYKPKASDKIYFDPMENGAPGLKAVFIETNEPLPVKEISSQAFQAINRFNKDGKTPSETINEMYLSNIITESEYIQLQERIQILTERSEDMWKML